MPARLSISPNAMMKSMSLFANQLLIKFVIWLFKKNCVIGFRLVFSRFFIFAEISEMSKKNRLEKLASPVKISARLYASTLQSFARRHSFSVNGVSIVIS